MARDFIMMSIGFSNTVEFGLITETCDFPSSGAGGFEGVWFIAESVISVSGGTLLLCERDCDWGCGCGWGCGVVEAEVEVSGVGSEDFSGWGVMEPRLLRGGILFLFKDAAFSEGD